MGEGILFGDGAGDDSRTLGDARPSALAPEAEPPRRWRVSHCSSCTRRSAASSESRSELRSASSLTRSLSARRHASRPFSTCPLRYAIAARTRLAMPSQNQSEHNTPNIRTVRKASKHWACSISILTGARDEYCIDQYRALFSTSVWHSNADTLFIQFLIV